MAKKKPKKTNAATLNFNLIRLEVIAAVLLFWFGVVITRNTIDPWERSLFISIYSWPEWLMPFFLAVTQLGNYVVLVGLAIAAFVFNKITLVVRLLMSGSFAYLLTGVAKDLVGRARPGELITEITLRDYSRGAGFPSGHMALATALAFTLGYHVPSKYRFITPLIIVLVGLSRIYLGVHAPLDLLGGFAIGWLAAEIFRFVEVKAVRM